MTTSLTAGQRKLAALERPGAAAFWARLLDGAPECGFPPDHAARPAAGAAPATATLHVEAALDERLAAMSRREDAALHVILTAGVVALLHEYGGDRDVVVGQPPPAAGDAEPLAEVLPLRLPVAPETSFRALLLGLRDVVRDALLHHDHPLDLAGTPVRVVVALEGLHAPAAVAALEAETVLLFRRERGGLVLDVRLDPAHFTAASAARIGRHCLRLLEQATAHPDRPLAAIDLRDEADRALVRAVNDTEHPFSDAATLPELFARTVRAAPHAPAVIAGETTLSFAELDARVNRLAAVLSASGTRPGTIVGVLAERSLELLVGVLAVVQAGGAYLPLDPGLPRDRLAFMLRDSGATLVLAQSEAVAAALGVRTPVLPLDAGEHDRGGARVETPAGPTDAAYVIYTSGSTGVPKGVVVEHRSVVNRIEWMQRAYPIGPGDVILHKTPFSFDVSVWELFWWSMVGATVCLPAPGAEREPAALVAAIERHRVTTLHFVPSMLGAWLDYVARSGESPRLSSLRRVFASGEALGAHHVRRFAELTGAQLVNLYGPTEATVDVSHHPCVPGEEPVPIGRPIDNLRLHVRDERLRPRPVGVPGELFIAGIGVARGYLNREELTRERFLTGAVPGEDRVYRTGDLVRWRADGALEYLGRSDDQLKLRGHRIEPGEVEHALRSHPAVREAAVVARPGAGGQLQLCAYVEADGELTEEALRAHAARTLPDHMVPTRIVAVPALPLTHNGKLDRRALPAPPPAAGRAVPPRTDGERILAGIWAEVLELPSVGIDDGFFALGGDSIHFVAVLAKARAQGLSFTFQELFQHPTVAALAEHIERRGALAETSRAVGPFELVGAGDRARLPADAEDAYPMSMLQAGLIFQSELTRGSSQYHDIISYLIRSGFDAGAFAQAVRLLVAEHPIFRTSYRLSGFSEYLQVVHREVESLPLLVADWRELDDDEQAAAYADWLAAEHEHVFDWERPGLVRLHVHILRDDLYRYSISQHNSALDGWSINLVHTRLFELYHALLAGAALPAEPADTHLRTFVGLELQSVRSEADREHWGRALAGAPWTEVPRLRAPEEDAPLRVVMHDVAVPAELSDRVVALADRLDVPVKNVLLAAHLKVLAVLSGNPDVLTGYEHGGRPEVAGAEAAMGLFLNTLPLRMQLAQGSWEQLIRQVYDAEAALLPHRRYPMAKVKQDLGTQLPLFETVFNFTHFYTLKQLRRLPEFALLDVRAIAITEFVLRAEFSRHFYTDAVGLSLHYHATALDADYVEWIGGCYVRALELMTAEPGADHDARPLAAAGELQELAGRRGDGSRSGAGRTGRRHATVHEPRAGEGELTSVAEQIAAVWAEVLGLERGELEAASNFFELGGNSLSAMRVAVLLNHLISIRDVMRHSTLGELAAVAAGAARAADDALLVELTPGSADSGATLVCFPYAAGHAVHFRPLAEAMARRDPDIAVLAFEPPGDDRRHRLEVDDLAALAAAEIEERVAGPVLLWGQCVGSALALAVARELARRGRPVEQVFLGAKLLRSPADLRAAIEHVTAMTAEDVRQWLTEEAGFAGLDQLGPEYRELLARTFRRDSTAANRHLLDAIEAGRAPLDAPCTLVVATDDPVTAGYATAYRRWEALVAGLRLVPIDGGHYFTRTRPARVADLVATAHRGAAAERAA